MNEHEKRRLERKAKVGWRQHYILKLTMLEILSVVNVVQERPTLAPIIRRMILNQEEYYRTCCICRRTINWRNCFSK